MAEPESGRRKQTGAAFTETLIGMMALGPLVLGAIQLALFYHAKSIVNYATFEAARAGAVANANPRMMKKAFFRNILPLYGSGSSLKSMVKSTYRAKKDVWVRTIPGTRYGAGGKLQILSPTRQAFNEHGMRIRNGKVIIPNDHLRYRDREVGDASKVSIQDANLLKIKITYGYKMVVPVINKMVAKVMTIADSRNAFYYQADPPRIPIVSYATVRMQSNVGWSSEISDRSRKAP